MSRKHMNFPSSPRKFLFSIFIILYLGLVEEGEKAYIYGPPNTPLKLSSTSVLHYIHDII